MYRDNDSHFANVPSIDIQRTRMKIPKEHITTWNVGQVIPVYCCEILPGDSVEMRHSCVVRLQTMLTPVFDNLELDLMWFFEPNRLVDDKWVNIMLENTASPWAPSTQYSIPRISAPSGGFARGTLADYFGLPIGVNWSVTDKNAPMAYPFRGYADIVNTYFRDENLSYPLNIPRNNSDQTGTNGSSYINDVANGGMPFVAAKNHDYFTSALPTAQKATQPVTFPLLSGSKAPVITTLDSIPSSSKGTVGIQFYAADGTEPNSVGYHDLYSYWNSNDHSGNLRAKGGSASGVNGSTDMYYAPLNLWADLSANVGAVTVNELRLAFQLQRFYERLALSGSRYQETIAAMFTVQSPDARLQRPEYLGGNRVPIVINEVVNTSTDQSASASPLGKLGAISNTSDINEDFVHSFTEHGFLFGLAVVRVSSRHYSQGIDKMWLRKTFSDFYWPPFAHLGEQPIPEVSIYADGYMDSDDVFGYQEAWAEYRYHPSIVSSYMRPGISGSLSSWHFGDYYTSAPTLSDGWIREPVANVDRTLAVTSAVSDQIFGDFYFDATFTRPMPMYSVPGLIDHF